MEPSPILVHEQSREIAIRLALGAQRSNILRMVLRQGLTLAAAGAGVGLVCAHWLFPIFMASLALRCLALRFLHLRRRDRRAHRRRHRRQLHSCAARHAASIRSLHSTPNDLLELLKARLHNLLQEANECDRTAELNVEA